MADKAKTFSICFQPLTRSTRIPRPILSVSVPDRIQSPLNDTATYFNLRIAHRIWGIQIEIRGSCTEFYLAFKVLSRV